MKDNSIWVRLEESEEIGELQSFALRLLEEGLGGDVRLIAYITNHNRTEMQSHIYDLSEKALIPLYEKYGEENVKFVETNSEQVRESSLSPLERIASALEGIESSLGSIEESLDNLADCVIEDKGMSSRFCVTGAVTAYEP